MKKMLLLLVPFFCLVTASYSADRPNFVLIFIDDMGYGDIGPYGSTLNRTPHLDQLAKKGKKLTSFYAAPVCSASRAQLLTGCYAPRVSVPGVFFPAGRQGLNPKEHTIADYLKELGYATACIGKWHLGDQREFLPTRQGFDSYFGIPYSNDMQRKSSETGLNVHPLMRNEEVAALLEDEDQRRVTREYTEEAVRFIADNKQNPFFLYFPHTAMHVPLFPHPDFTGKSNNGTYGDWVEEVDWSVGQVVKALDDHGLAENTLLVFTSDNGPWASKGNAGGVSGPLRGSKGGTLEGGVREPTIVRWTGKIKPGSESSEIAGTIDLLPTFVSLAGGQIKTDWKIDGKDITGLLCGDAEASPHQAWYFYRGNSLKAVRSGPWKLALSAQSLGMGIKEKPEDLQGPKLRLYHLEKEVGEVTNVAEQHPEVVARMQKLADRMIADIGNGKAGPGVRPCGVVEHPVTLYPTVARSRGPKKSAAKYKPLDWKKLKSGDTVASSKAPQIAGKTFTIRATLTGDAAEGMIVSHGGSQVGYALYATKGTLVFALRDSSEAIRRLKLSLPAKGAARVLARLDVKGLAVLECGDERVTSVIPGPLSRHPMEDLCIGHDAANPVDAQAPTKAFSGSVSELAITVK